MIYFLFSWHYPHPGMAHLGNSSSTVITKSKSKSLSQRSVNITLMPLQIALYCEVSTLVMITVSIWTSVTKKESVVAGEGPIL